MISEFCTKCEKHVKQKYSSWCKICISNYKKEYNLKNKNKISQQNKKKYLNNKQHLINKSKKYYQDHKKEKKLYDQKRRSIKKELLQEKSRQHYLKNKKSYLYRTKVRSKKLYHENACFKLKNRVSSDVRKYLNKKNISKNSSIINNLPYSMEEIKNHIESLFESWMNWDNWGKYNKNTWDDNNSLTWTWQLDHIIPHSKFNYTSMQDTEFKKCWSLKNLRPLSAKQNIIDGARRKRDDDGNG
jgi:hypothetical protein